MSVKELETFAARTSLDSLDIGWIIRKIFLPYLLRIWFLPAPDAMSKYTFLFGNAGLCKYLPNSARQNVCFLDRI